MEEHLSVDQVFISKLTEIVLANLTDGNFNVEKLAKEAGISRITLYRRIRSIKRQDISQFIRSVRLRRAMEMLQNNEGTVAEIAFRVGFGSATYFNKCFHEYFGFPPGEVRKIVIAESLNNLTDGQYGESDALKDLNSKSGVKSLSKKIQHKKLLIASSGILSALLVIYLLYVLVIKDSGIRPDAKYPEKSIVVLPFKNLSDDSENQYFADGIMEDILNHLFRIKELRVISRTTAESFRGKSITSPEIARKLNVNYVLEGSVYKSENKIKLFVQLIDARNDQHIMSEKYEDDMNNIFELQSDIAKKIANVLETVLTNAEIGKIERKPTQSFDAYDYYLKARFLLHKSNDVQRLDISKQGLTASIPYYEKAIAADSNFAEAYAGMANAWYNLCAWGWYKPYYEGVQKARDFSNKALEIDPDCAEAHAVKGAYLIYPEFKLGEASRELQISLQLNPNYATAHQWYAQLLMITGPIEEARVHIDRALELEPYFWVVHNLNSWIYYFEEKYQEGLDACFTGLDLNPNSSDNNWLFVLHYVKLGEGEKAAKVLHDNFSRYQATSKYADEILDAFNESGIKGIFTWLIDFNINRPVPLEGLNGDPYYIAWWYAILGNREESIYWFERTMEAKTKPLQYFNLIANNPDFDILRDDPRFIAIIEKAGLAPYHTRKAR
jgi:TolB-like protein/AraC-like DNA-binding protein